MSPSRLLYLSGAIFLYNKLFALLEKIANRVYKMTEYSKIKINGKYFYHQAQSY
jgi:hypothetical protein